MASYFFFYDKLNNPFGSEKHNPLHPLVLPSIAAAPTPVLVRITIPAMMQALTESGGT